MQNCKFASVVVLSEEKIVAQLDCTDSSDGGRALLNKIAKVDGVVQTNIIAVVRPVKRWRGGSQIKSTPFQRQMAMRPVPTMTSMIAHQGMYHCGIETRLSVARL